MSKIDIAHGLHSFENMVSARLISLTSERDYSHVASRAWTSDETSLPESLTQDLEVVASLIQESSEEFPEEAFEVWTKLFSGDNYLLLVSVSTIPAINDIPTRLTITLRVSADDVATPNQVISRFMEACPPMEEKELEDDQVEVSFWMNTQYGSEDFTRRLDAEEWDEIQKNYPQEVRSSVQHLTQEDFRPDGTGQLILWHGPPGTGKTTAIRSLVKSWADFANSHYLTDPERFFGEADYMVSTVLQQCRDESRWNLLIVEDASELIVTDSHEQSSQGFSRLLNLVDGMIGQGLKLVVLITTNEPFDELHPAVRRPGRCLSEVHFRPFTEEEANQWLRSKGSQVSVNSSKERSLAELYSLIG